MALKTVRLLLGVAGLFALSSLSFGQIVKTKAGYLLRAHYVKGTTLHYDSTNTVTGGGTTVAPFHIKVTVQVLDVIRGIATVKVTQGQIAVGGQVLAAASSITMPLDSRNKSNSKSSNSAVGPVLPPKPIKPGSIWEALVPVNMLGATRPMNMRYKFAGMKLVNGKLEAVVTFTMGGAVAGEGTMYIRAADGLIDRSEISLGLGGAAGASSAAMAQVHMILKRQ